MGGASAAKHVDITDQPEFDQPEREEGGLDCLGAWAGRR